MSLVPFFIPNSSPLLSYTPCVDCGPAGWASAYTPRPDGFDQTFHQSTGEGHTVSFNLTSNGFGVTHATVAPECPLEYSINGSDFRSTCETADNGEGGGLTKLDYGRHEVVLRTGNVTIFQFYGISGNYILPQDEKHVNRTLPVEAYTYTPQESWTFLHDDGRVEGNATFLSEYTDSKMGSTSMSMTDKAASVDITFTGSTIYLYGISGPQGGGAQVKLDDVLVADLNMTSTWQTPGVLLYTAGGLDGTRAHRLSISNTVPGKHLVVDYAIITADRPANKSLTPTPPLIAGVIGGIVLIILLGIVLYFYLIARMKYKLRPSASSSTGSGSGSGFGNKTPRPNIKVDSWRKQTPPQSADACSPMDTYHTESIYGGILAPLGQHLDQSPNREKKKKQSSSSGHWPIARLYTKPNNHNQNRNRGASFVTLRSDGGGTNISAPSLPDFIPYKSPFGSGSGLGSGTAISDFARSPSQLGSNAPRHGHSPLTTGRSGGSMPITPKSGLRDEIMDRGRGGGGLGSGYKSPVTPPAIAGLDSTAERWLQENTYVGQGQGQEQPSRTISSKPHRTVSRASRRSEQSQTEDDHDHDNPSPIQENFEIVGVTHHAQNARRSIARLWHTRDTVPSLYRSESLTLELGSKSQDIPLKRSNTVNSATTTDLNLNLIQVGIIKQLPAQAAAVTLNQTVPVSASLTATAGLSSTNDFFQSFIRPSPPISTSSYAFTRPRIATSASPAQPSTRRPATPRASSPDRAGGGGASLRRGVSIKSVKSFFSGWVKPQLEGQGQGHSNRFESDTPARPDSGIFPRTQTQLLGLGSVDVPLTTSTGTGTGRSGGSGSGSGSANMFIELDPESPLTASRPASEWPNKQRTWGSRV